MTHLTVGIGVKLSSQRLTSPRPLLPPCMADARNESGTSWGLTWYCAQYDEGDGDGPHGASSVRPERGRSLKPRTTSPDNLPQTVQTTSPNDEAREGVMCVFQIGHHDTELTHIMHWTPRDSVICASSIFETRAAQPLASGCVSSQANSAASGA